MGVTYSIFQRQSPYDIVIGNLCHFDEVHLQW